MATPKHGYWVDGKRVPGTTTIIGRFKDSSALLHWAFKQGQEGKARLYGEAEKAADIGTIAHEMIEAHVNGFDPAHILDEHNTRNVSMDMKIKATNAFNMFREWESQTGLELLSRYQEIQLVSPMYMFGGTPDAIGKINGKIVLLDWKTSNGVYPDYLLQLAAYRHLIGSGRQMIDGEELRIDGERVRIQGAHLLRFPKEYPDFDHRYFGDLDQAWEQFKLFRKAYDIDKELKKRT